MNRLFNKPGNGIQSPEVPDASVGGLLPSRMDKIIEGWLERTIAASGAASQEVLQRAMHHAVFSGEERRYARVVIQTASAHGLPEAELDLAVRAACAVELLHAIATLRDDLPCFDDCPERNARPTVHARYGEAVAMMAGDALYALVFDLIAQAPARLASRALRLTRVFAEATGASSVILGGGAACGDSAEPAGFPCEASEDSPAERYHAAKRAALYRLAAQVGSVASSAAIAGPAPQRFRNAA